MTTIPNCGGNDTSHVQIWNYADNELYLKLLSLESQKLKRCGIKQNLLSINANNESISKSLLKIKTDYEGHLFFLRKALYDLKISTDKQKVLLENKLDDFYSKRKAFEVYYKLSPIKCELEELINRNKNLEEEWKNKNDLFELTKKQYYELLSLIIETFKMKVCEFCDTVLKQKANCLKT